MGKRTKASLAVEADDDLEEEEDAAEEPPAKRAQKSRAAVLKDLEPGLFVVTWDEWQGIVQDVDVENNRVWVADSETGELQAVAFRADQIWVLKKQPSPPDILMQNGFGTIVGAIVIGTERQMVPILQHYGPPDTPRRRHPQQLLSVDCSQLYAERDILMQLASQGIDPCVPARAARLRSDISPQQRVCHLQNALRQLGPDVRQLADMYLLAGVVVPFSRVDLESHKGWEKHWRQHVWNQVDVSITACGPCLEEDENIHLAAQRVFSTSLGVVIDEMFWSKQVQWALREHLGVNLPIKIRGPFGAKVFVIVLPSTAQAVGVRKGLLYIEEEQEKGGGGGAGGGGLDPLSLPQAKKKEEQNNEQTQLIGGKTIAEWKKEQVQFAGLPKLPADWIRIRSRSDSNIYFYNLKSGVSTYDMPQLPLPPGWTQHVSKSTGKTYYFNAKKQESSYERPVA